ncbi:MAG: hypothetical protein HY952_07905 [Elusimicrobia bacterium]|nr:hypothetical protein [Elusimicrobiota bacterium]
MDEEVKAKAALYAAIFLTFLGYGGRFAGMEPVHNQFFAWAAWAYILFADNLAYRISGSSPAVSRTGELLRLAGWSVALCALLELLNLRLGIWYYVWQPSTLALRWTGRFFSWAAFLPALFITAELLRAAGLFRSIKTPPLKVTPGLLEASLIAGAALLALPLAFPALSSLVWASFLLLAEPLNYRLGLPSLLREWQGGLPGKTLRLFACGALSGLLWNAWNGASGARWEYAATGKWWPELLGLPLPGYAALGLFALGAYSLCALTGWLRAGKTWEETSWTLPGAKPPAWAMPAAWSIIIITSYIALRLADTYSVKLYIGWL